MKVVYYTILFVLGSLIKAQEKEVYLNADEIGNVNANVDGSQNLSSHVEFDGLILKVTEVVFESIMKKIKYALVFFYEDNCSECDNVLNELKLATESIVKINPPVGVFKMKCSENKKICQDEQKEMIPFVIWINNDNLGYMKEKNSFSFIKIAEKMAKSNKISLIEDKNDFNDFISHKNYFRILAIVPNMKSIKNQNITTEFNNSHLIDDYFEKAVSESFLLNIGEYSLGKIIDYNLIESLNILNITRTTILIYYKDEIIDFPSLIGMSNSKLNEYSEKYSFIKQFTGEARFTYYIKRNESLYRDKDSFISEIVYNSLPYIFPLNNNIYNIVFSGPIRRQFLYILSPNHTVEDNFKRLEIYNNNSKNFRNKGYYVWFGFVVYDSLAKQMFSSELEELNKKETDLPLLIFFDFKKIGDEAMREDVEKRLLTKELNNKNLEELYISTTNHSRRQSDEIVLSEEPENIKYESFKNESDIPKVVGKNFQQLVINFPDNVLILMQDSDPYKQNLYNQWIFLLSKIRKLINHKILRIYKFDVEKNDLIASKLPSKYPTVRMFMRHGKNNPIDYDNEIKLEIFCKFLNHLIPTLDIKFTQQQIKSFENEIDINKNFIYEKKSDDINLDDHDGEDRSNKIGDKNIINSDRIKNQKTDL